VCQKIARAHGGFVDPKKSPMEAGARRGWSSPRVQRDRRCCMSQPSGLGRRRRGISYAQAIEREISRQGIFCDLAYNCREALEFGREPQYGVILLDHRLPDDDGIRIISASRRST